MIRRLFCGILLLTVGVLTSWAANGFSVSVSYNGGDQGIRGYWRGSIVRYRIGGDAVTSSDTIYSKANGYAYYPVINLEGTKVAFYRWGTPSQIAVVDLASKQVTNLAALPADPGNEMPLDWPAGNWIYYVLPQNPGDDDPVVRQSTEIWRVNVSTKANEKYVYINDGRVPMPPTPSGWGPLFPAFIRRLEISLDGTRAAIQGNNFAHPDGSYYNVNSVYCFPPPGGTVSDDGACYIGNPGASCNISLSCSGGYCAGYISGWHDLLTTGKLPGAIGPSIADLQLNTIESWYGQDIGQGAELVRWARNSDKWVLQQIAFSGLEVGGGSNQVLANWVDHKAIRTSHNIKGDHWSSCTGDFWVDGGAANAGKYEGADGVWRTPAVTGTDRSIHQRSPLSGARFQSRAQEISLKKSGSAGANSVAGTRSAYDLRGRNKTRTTVESAGIGIVKN